MTKSKYENFFWIIFTESYSVDTMTEHILYLCRFRRCVHLSQKYLAKFALILWKIFYWTTDLKFEAFCWNDISSLFFSILNPKPPTFVCDGISSRRFSISNMIFLLFWKENYNHQKWPQTSLRSKKFNDTNAQIFFSAASCSN